jgi:hypothetical protein
VQGTVRDRLAFCQLTAEDHHHPHWSAEAL